MTFLNSKESSTHLVVVKIDSDVIQDMKTLHGHASILFFVASNYSVVFPDFDSLDESLSYRKELVPKPTHPSCLQFNSRFEHVDKLLANRLVMVPVMRMLLGN